MVNFEVFFIHKILSMHSNPIKSVFQKSNQTPKHGFLCRKESNFDITIETRTLNIIFKPNWEQKSYASFLCKFYNCNSYIFLGFFVTEYNFAWN